MLEGLKRWGNFISPKVMSPVAATIFLIASFEIHMRLSFQMVSPSRSRPGQHQRDPHGSQLPSPYVAAPDVLRTMDPDVSKMNSR